MGLKTVVLGSVTFAQRGRNLLLSKGVSATLARSRAGGCHYGVRVAEEELEKALSFLHSAGMKTEVV